MRHHYLYINEGTNQINLATQDLSVLRGCIDFLGIGTRRHNNIQHTQEPVPLLSAGQSAGQANDKSTSLSRTAILIMTDHSYFRLLITASYFIVRPLFSIHVRLVRLLLRRKLVKGPPDWDLFFVGLGHGGRYLARTRFVILDIPIN
jgi:hypothetical protein